MDGRALEASARAQEGDTLFFSLSHFLVSVQVFYDPLLAQLKDERLNLIFGNGTAAAASFFFRKAVYTSLVVKEIERANKELCAKLEKMVGQFSSEEKSVLFYVASTFIEMAPKLVCYDRYCKNYDRAIELYQTMIEEPEFSKAVEAQRTKWGMRVGGLLLSDFLIKPVQRICKYPLLFKALIGYTAEDHSDMPLLKKADRAMNQAAEEVNRARKDQKSAQDLKEIDDSMEGYTGGSLVVPGRFLIKSGTLVKLSPSGSKQERSFFLFTDMILYAKKGKKTYEYKDHIELAELTVLNADKGFAKGLSAAELELCFGLMRQDKRKKKLYVIIAETAADKKSWMQALTEAIETANRRKQTVSEDAVLQLESRIGSRKRGETVQPESTQRTFSLFKSGKSPRTLSVTASDELEAGSPGSGSDEVVLNAVKSIRGQVADTTKLLSQAQSLQAKLQERVEVMQRMVDLEALARQDLEQRLARLEAAAEGKPVEEMSSATPPESSPSPLDIPKPSKPLPVLRAKVEPAAPIAKAPELTRQWTSSDSLLTGSTAVKSPQAPPRSKPSVPAPIPVPNGGLTREKTRSLPSKAPVRKPLPTAKALTQSSSDPDLSSTPPIPGLMDD